MFDRFPFAFVEFIQHKDVIKINNFVLSVIAGIVASIILKWLEFVFRRIKNNDDSESIACSKNYVDKLIKQFYTCFPSGMGFLVWRIFTPDDSFLATLQVTFAAILLMFSLFAFMCAVEVIKTFSNNESENKTKDTL